MSKFNAPESKTCCKCLKNKNTKDNYYLASDDKINTDGRLSICKSCLEEVANITVIEDFIDALRRIDRPFIKAEYDASLLHNNPFGEYMRRMGMRQNRELTYADSQFSEDLSKYMAKNTNDLNRKVEVNEVVKFKVTPDLIIKWGENYTEAEIFQLEEFYKRMERSNSISTPQLMENLKVLCKLNLKQNKALDEDNHTAFKNLNTQYATVLRDSGFRPIDRQGSNETIGIRSFSQIWEEIEKDGFIPKHKVETTQEIVDNTILHLENYTRRFLNMQTVHEPSGETPQVTDYE